MRKTVKKAVFCLLLCVLVSVPVFSGPEQIEIKDLKKTMNSFVDELALSLPFNSSMGLNWADAYIKNFPHFGVGFSVGFTTMELSAFNKLIDYFSPALPGWVKGFGGFPLPGYALEARLGGFGIPFDLGFKFGFMPIKPQNFQFERLDYFLIGGDFRYAVLKENVILPSISVGLGFSYMKGGLGMAAGNGTKINYKDFSDTDQYIELGAPKLNADWSTASLDFKAQISKTFVVITPYLGIGASNGWSKAGYSITSVITDSAGNIDEAKRVMKKIGIGNFDEKGFGAMSNTVPGWSFRVYGGFAFNIAKIVKLDFTGLYNFRDHKFGTTIGARLQF